MSREYRVTRPRIYGPRSHGFNDLSARQGYYVTADHPWLAARKLLTDYPDDNCVDVQTPDGRRMRYDRDSFEWEGR